MWSWKSICFAAVVLGWTIVYYATSAGSGIWNKRLVDDDAVSPTVLTLLHLIVSLASDVAIMRYNARSRDGGSGGKGAPEPAKTAAEVLIGSHSLYDIVVSFTPISIFVIMAKLATYLSYQTVSIALSHTAKASEPIFNVIVAAVVFREYHSRPVYLSLVPIALGVGLASVTDFSYNHTGFLWATTSALMKVLQNIYTKRLMNSGKFTFWEIHLYCGAASLLILAPVLWVQTVTSDHNPFAHFPVFSLTMCSLLQYASSVSSYMVLNLVAHLTFTIVNVMKRLVIILSGMQYNHQGFGVLNTIGVLLSLVGILAYNLVKDTVGGPAGSGPQLTDVWSVSSWLAWLHALVWRYNHRGEPAGGVSPLNGVANGGGGGNGSLLPLSSSSSSFAQPNGGMLLVGSGASGGHFHLVSNNSHSGGYGGGGGGDGAGGGNRLSVNAFTFRVTNSGAGGASSPIATSALGGGRGAAGHGYSSSSSSSSSSGGGRHGASSGAGAVPHNSSSSSSGGNDVTRNRKTGSTGGGVGASGSINGATAGGGAAAGGRKSAALAPSTPPPATSAAGGGMLLGSFMSPLNTPFGALFGGRGRNKSPTSDGAPSHGDDEVEEEEAGDAEYSEMVGTSHFVARGPGDAVVLGDQHANDPYALYAAVSGTEIQELAQGGRSPRAGEAGASSSSPRLRASAAGAGAPTPVLLSYTTPAGSVSNSGGAAGPGGRSLTLSGGSGSLLHSQAAAPPAPTRTPAPPLHVVTLLR